MQIPSIYINLEDDVSKITARLKRHSAKQVVLVCPKRCFLFNDSINLRLLKKNADLLKKEVSILTMDEKGQLYAKEAGFTLKFLPKQKVFPSFSDIKSVRTAPPADEEDEPEKENFLAAAAQGMHSLAEKFAGKEAGAGIAVPRTKKGPVNAVVPKVSVKESIFPKDVFSGIGMEKPKSRKRGKKLVFWFLGLLTLAFVAVFGILPQATVAVYPKSEPVTRDMEISADLGLKQIDPVKLLMPAEALSETVNITGKFQSQGKKPVGNKSSGTVRIYNFTRQPINLKAGTTVLILGGKNYYLASDQMGVKPAAYSNPKTKEVDLSSLGEPVEIIAAEGGEDYNLPIGTRLEITNQVFGSKPQFLYAKTDSEISGGTTRYLSVVSPADIEQAKAELQSRALAEIAQKLGSQGKVLYDKAFNFEIDAYTTSSASGTETPSFQATLVGKVNGLSVLSGDLQDIISQRISQTLAANKTLRPRDHDAITVKVKSFDLNSGIAVFMVHYEGKTLYNVDLSNVEKELAGKAKEHVNDILNARSEISRVDVILSPSWQTIFPLLTSRIKVVVKDTEAGDE